MRIFQALVILLLLANNIYALDFNRLGGTFTMVGAIEKDDSIKFLVELGTLEVPPTAFHITSNGGNLEEAMRIGEVIRESHIPVWTGEECDSACVFIYASGVERDAQGKIGLHRPYFDKLYFSNLTAMDAKKQYHELQLKSAEYLKNMEVSQTIIDRIFQTGSTEVDMLDKDAANKLFGSRSPFYEEWLTAKCGKFTDEQHRVLKSWSYLQAARATVAIAKDESISKSESFGSNIYELIEGGKLAFQLEKAGMLDSYIELSKLHNKCEKEAKSAHIYSFHKSIQKYVLDLIK